GIYFLGNGSPIVSSTIVAGNTAGGGPGAGADLFAGKATNVAGDNNLIGIMDAGNNTTLTGAGQQVGSVATPLNPMLGPLANNGGPTQTHLPAAGSPTFNKGNNAAGLTTDQRGTGFPRVSGPSADVGSIELFDPTPGGAASGKTVDLAGGTTQTVTVVYND